MKIAISGVGMITSVGVSADQSFASIRAGITRMQEVPEIYYCMPDDSDFEDGEPLIAVPLSYLAAEREKKKLPVEWFAYLSALAFKDLEKKINLPKETYNEIALLMTLPQKRTGWEGKANEDEFIYHFHNSIQKDIFPFELFYYEGSGGAIYYLEHAIELITSKGFKYVLVGAVDSYMFSEYLELLDKEYRIKSDKNLDGFIPGESAGFLLLETEQQAGSRKVKPLGTILGTAKEKCCKDDFEMNTGIALSKIVSDLLQKIAAPPVIICDLNGEPARMKEWGFVRTRIGEKLGDPVSLEHPADCIGDIGSASGTVLAGLATYFLKKKYQEYKAAIVWTASDSGERSAVLIGRE